MHEYTVKIIDATTGEESVREATFDERVGFERSVAESNAEILKLAEKAAARQALLAKLGITEDEAKLLLS